ncbi:MAG: ADP compounds hydrolase NudE [Gammaproteobacteria bacterium]
MAEKPKILTQKIVAESRIFKIEQIDLMFGNGEQRQFERISGKRGVGTVLMVPILNNDTLILIREYGVGLERYELALPKGILESGENTVDAANRELKEEIGYGAQQLVLLKTISSAPGYSSSQMHIVLAQDLYPERLVGDEPEPIEVVPWPLNQVGELLQRDDFTEARSIAALFLALQHLQN